MTENVTTTDQFYLRKGLATTLCYRATPPDTLTHPHTHSRHMSFIAFGGAAEDNSPRLGRCAFTAS